MKNEKENNKFDLLNLFQSKARCIYTQEKAASIFEKLSEHLSAKQRGDLISARGHFLTRLGPGELDHVCEKIRNEWTNERNGRI